METVIEIVHFLATHLWLPFIIVFVLSALQIIIPVLKADRAPKEQEKSSYKGMLKHIIVLSGTMAILFLGMFQLSNWSNSLIYNYGKEGTGIITRITQTSNMYNQQYVMRYVVLLKKEDGDPVETQFKSSDFNVYPAENAVTYPKVGEQFAIRYLPSNPQIFVILTNKKSEYTARLACGKAYDDLAEAEAAFKADSLSKNSRSKYAKALEQLLEADCYKGSALKEEFIKIDQATIKRLKAE